MSTSDSISKEKEGSQLGVLIGVDHLAGAGKGARIRLLAVLRSVFPLLLSLSDSGLQFSACGKLISDEGLGVRAGV